VDVVPGRVVQLRRRGGVRERADRIDVYEPDNHPLFVEGESLILFLRAYRAVPPEPAIGTYFVETTYGPDSVFAMGTGDQLQARGTSRLSRELGVLGAESFRKRLGPK